eukprot:755893-Hanusia_phi.AAC.3
MEEEQEEEVVVAERTGAGGEEEASYLGEPERMARNHDVRSSGMRRLRLVLCYAASQQLPYPPPRRLDQRPSSSLPRRHLPHPLAAGESSGGRSSLP